MGDDPDTLQVTYYFDALVGLSYTSFSDKRNRIDENKTIRTDLPAGGITSARSNAREK
jgi:hypothetical protein